MTDFSDADNVKFEIPDFPRWRSGRHKFGGGADTYAKCTKTLGHGRSHVNPSMSQYSEFTIVDRHDSQNLVKSNIVRWSPILFSPSPKKKLINRIIDFADAPKTHYVIFQLVPRSDKASHSPAPALLKRIANYGNLLVIDAAVAK